jgi:hypothetical protein
LDRFSNASGSLNEDKFHQAYQFLEQYQEDEIQVLKKQVKKTKGKEKGAALETELFKYGSVMTARSHLF